MAKSWIQRQIERATGQSRFSSGAATKNSKRIYNESRKKSHGGMGG